MDELVKRLRAECTLPFQTLQLMREAANAIEELTRLVQEAERDRDEYRERLDKANDAIEELQKRVPKVPHGRLIDADEFLKRAIETKCFRGDYALMLEELVGESATIIPAEEGE